MIKDQGFDIVYNPPGDGNCQFAALAQLLQGIGICRSPKTLGEEIIRHLQVNPFGVDGGPLLEFVPEFDTWEEHVAYMAQDSTFGDQHTVFAAANLFNVNIAIVSSLGPGASHVFTPTNGHPLTTVYLGQFAENHGEHYISLVPNGSVEGVGYESSECSDVEKDNSEETVQFLNNHILETIIKVTMASFPYMRQDLRAVNNFFKQTVDKVPYPSVYICELPRAPAVVSVKKIISLKDKSSGAMMRICDIINSLRWHNACLKLVPQLFGWFVLVGIYLKSKFARA